MAQGTLHKEALTIVGVHQGCGEGVKHHPSRSAHHIDQHEMDRAIAELREDLEHERDRRYTLTNSVRKHRNDRDADRVSYAFAQLRVERDVRSLVD